MSTPELNAAFHTELSRHIEHGEDAYCSAILAYLAALPREAPVAFVDITGTVSIPEGSPLGDMVRALPKPPVGKATLPLYAFPAEAGAPVAVKALEWSNPGLGVLYADTIVGTYKINPDGFWWLADGSMKTAHSVGAAKAAAQTDYETRIRSALASPVPQGEAVAWDVCTADGDVASSFRKEAQAHADAAHFNRHGVKAVVKPLYYASPRDAVTESQGGSQP